MRGCGDAVDSQAIQVQYRLRNAGRDPVRQQAELQARSAAQAQAWRGIHAYDRNIIDICLVDIAACALTNVRPFRLPGTQRPAAEPVLRGSAAA